MRRLILVLTVLALLVTPALPQNKTADESALRARVGAFEAALNKRDLAAVAALFAPDADTIVNDAPLATGREAIRAALQRDWGSAPTVRRITLTVTSIRFVGSDVALVNTRAQFSEGTVKEDRGTWILAKQPGGTWLITAMRVMPKSR